MRKAVVVLGGVALLVSAGAPRSSAQTGTTGGAARSKEERRVSQQAHKGDFDYLLGDWEFTAENRENGTFRGFWTAVRLGQGQILDEYRVVDNLGATVYATTTLRTYNSAADRWELVGMDGDNGLQDLGTGQRAGGEIHIEQRFGVTTPTPSLWKIRYFNIAPERFSWAADRSPDNGKTWVTNYQTIEARRIGPARSLGALSGPRPGTELSSAKGDPITGQWGFGGVTFLELAFDGKTGVSGSAIWRTDSGEHRTPIKNGTFDSQTGALRLEGEAKRPDTGETARYLIEGTLTAGVLTGTYHLDTNTGEFSFTRK